MNRTTKINDKDNYFTKPAYLSWKNRFEGLTIATNDIWSTEVVLTSLVFKGTQYEAKYTVTLWDHFGLDYPDMKKIPNIIPSRGNVYLLVYFATS